MTHTPGAERAAKIIMDGRKWLDTAYGPKSEEGIADLIDRQSDRPKERQR